MQEAHAGRSHLRFEVPAGKGSDPRRECTRNIARGALAVTHGHIAFDRGELQCVQAIDGARVRMVGGH